MLDVGTWDFAARADDPVTVGANLYLPVAHI